ncbi:MAG: hypothetical protein LBM77_03005 [Spirochaetaceae bacterium]|nr:hypothetical protein [Spirochaetaceae bacterium]
MTLLESGVTKARTPDETGWLTPKPDPIAPVPINPAAGGIFLVHLLTKKIPPADERRFQGCAKPKNLENKIKLSKHNACKPMTPAPKGLARFLPPVGCATLGCKNRAKGGLRRSRSGVEVWGLSLIGFLGKQF